VKISSAIVVLLQADLWWCQ